MVKQHIYSYDRYMIICDSEDDVADLPTATNKVDGYHTPYVGDVAFVIEDVACYMYGGDEEWHLLE